MKGWVDVILVDGEDEWSARVPGLPSMGDVFRLHNGRLSRVIGVEFQQKSYYVDREGAKWRVIITLGQS